MYCRRLWLKVRRTTEIQPKLIEEIKVGEGNRKTNLGDRPRNQPIGQKKITKNRWCDQKGMTIVRLINELQFINPGEI